MCYYYSMNTTKKCKQCGNIFAKQSKWGAKKWASRFLCSHSCTGRWRKGEKRKNLREKHSGWKGGRKKTLGGYILVYAPDHPYAQSHGYILEHRLVVETSLGRHLHPKEVVHHIDGDKTNNKLENLKLVSTHREHLDYHAQNRDPFTGRFIGN